MSGLSPVSGMPLSYTGTIAVPYILRNFSPTITDITFRVPTIWVNPSTGTAWILLQNPTTPGANWVPLTGGSGTVTSFQTTFDGNTAVPSAGLIEFISGTGMEVTSVNGSNQITFSSLGGGFTWNSVSGTSQALVAGNGYVPTNSSQTVFSLPATAAFGNTYSIAGLGTGGWTISQGAGQSIILGSVTSTVGAGGSITSTLASDDITLLCVVANTTFKMITMTGNLTVV